MMDWLSPWYKALEADQALRLDLPATVESQRKLYRARAASGDTRLSTIMLSVSPESLVMVKRPPGEWRGRPKGPRGSYAKKLTESNP
jgi:hypothetical protein